MLIDMDEQVNARLVDNTEEESTDSRDGAVKGGELVDPVTEVYLDLVKTIFNLCENPDCPGLIVGFHKEKMAEPTGIQSTFELQRLAEKKAKQGVK